MTRQETRHKQDKRHDISKIQEIGQETIDKTRDKTGNKTGIRTRHRLKMPF